MKSCLYTGEVVHRRFTPVGHEFTYQVCFYYLDLDELPRLFRFPLLFSLNSWGLISFWRKDYFGKKEVPLKEAVSGLIKDRTGEDFRGPVRLLTYVSYLGHCFNSVSFYYCFEGDGETLRYVVSEVTNTPWGERHQEVLRFEKPEKNAWALKKEFHVSPFIPMNIDYTWVFEKPAEELKVLMQNRYTGEQQLMFDCTLTLKREELNARNVTKSFFKYPLMTLKGLVAIYYQAAVLYLIRRVPFYSHPPKEKLHDDSTAA